MVNNLLSIHAKSFSWAGFFLPSDVYKNGSDLYDFCRTLDDIADEEISLEIKKKKFLNYKNDFINHNFENDSIKKIHRIIKNFDVSEKIVLDLFDGIESDLKEKIELKSKKGRPTKEQIEWIKALQKRGYMASICKGLEEAVAVIDNYIKNKI